MNTVYLHGSLGKRFGRKWEISARNSHDVIKALDANNEGFVEYIIKQSLEGNEHFLLAKHPEKIKTRDDFLENIVQVREINQEVHIVPSVYGGFIATALTTMFTGMSGAVAGAISGAIWGGIAQIAIGAMTKAPDQKPMSTPESISTKSFLLSASSESASQGGVVPVGYGRMVIGPCLISQSMLSYKRSGAKYLESYSELKFDHLLCEGPIEGPVNEHGHPLSLVQSGDEVQSAIYINGIQLKKGSFYNFNLNEKDVIPDINLGGRQSKLVGDYTGTIYTYNQQLFGVSPYYNKSSSTIVNIANALADGTIFSHKIKDENTGEVALNFLTTVFSNNGKGTNTSDSVYFAIFVVDEGGNRSNVLSSDKVRLLDRDKLKNIGVVVDSEKFRITGIATSGYQFQIRLVLSGFENHTPTIQIVKLSKETDSAAAAAVYTTWVTTSRGGFFNTRVRSHQHEKTTYNAIGGQGRSRNLNISSIEERVKGKFSYPNCATSSILIDSVNFSQQPSFQWHLKLKKVLIPSNYNPVTRKYNGPWNGLFKGQNDSSESIYSIDESNKFWTDNPAWIFYDLVSSPVYGCGKYGIEQENIDKWQLYKIAKYCDELVETNYPVETSTGLPATFEFFSSDSDDNNSQRNTFDIKIDEKEYSYSTQEGIISKDLSSNSEFQTYYEFNNEDGDITIPEGVISVEVTVIGAGGSGQGRANTILMNTSRVNGNNGQSSEVSFTSTSDDSLNWSIKCLGGTGGGRSKTDEELIQIENAEKVFSKVEGIHWKNKWRHGRDRIGSSDGRIAGALGSTTSVTSSSVSRTPSYGAGSSCGRMVSPKWKLFFSEATQRNNWKSAGYLIGGGSGSAAVAKFKVSEGDVINVNVGRGGAGVGVSGIQSARGGSGRVIVKLHTESDFSGLSSRERFIKSFGDRRSFQGKTVAFFIHKQKFGDDAANYKEKIKENSVIRKNCQIERRQIVYSDPDTFKVTLSGEGFRDNLSAFNFAPDSSVKILYGACAAEINHPAVEPRFTANFFLKQAAQSTDILGMFANLFRSRLSYSSGFISLEQDSKRLPIQLYNNTNVGKEGFAYSGTDKNQRFSVVKVLYKNKDTEFDEKYVYEEDTAAIKQIGIVETEISALSITSESEARRFAKWVLLSAQYEQEVVKFSAGNEGLLTFPGAIIEVFDEMRSGNLRSGRVLDIDIDNDNPYLLIDKSILKEPMLDDVELTVSAGLDNIKRENVNSSARTSGTGGLRGLFGARNQKSEIDQDYEIENIKSQQLLKFNARIIPDIDESKSRVVDLIFKMQFELIEEENIFKVFRHGLKNGDKVRFLSSGMLPTGLSAFKDYFVINSTENSFQVSETDGGSEVNLLDSGKDRLLNIGGEHFVSPVDNDRSQLYIDQVMIGAVYSIKGNIGVLEDSKPDITSENLNNLGVTEQLSENWVVSNIFGEIKIYDKNWIFAKNLGWIYVGDMISRDMSGYFWFYIGSIGWVGTEESVKSNTWFIPSLKQSYQNSTGFVSIFKHEYNICNIFVHFDSSVDSNIDSFILGGTERQQGRLCKVDTFNGSVNGYMLNVLDYEQTVPTFTAVDNFSTLNEEKYLSIDIEDIYSEDESESIQQEACTRVKVSGLVDVDFYKNYNLFIEGVTSSNQELINKPWHFIFVREDLIELVDSDISLGSGLNFENAKIYLLRKFDSDFKKYIEKKYFRVVSNKEIESGRFEIIASEYSFDKFDAIDKKGVIRTPVLPIPPQESMEIPEAPTNLVLYTSTT